MSGVDIGGTKIAIGLVDESGRVVVRRDIPVMVEAGPSHATSRIVEVLKDQASQVGVDIAGVGIGCTGPVNPTTGVLEDVNTLPGWQGWNPVEELSGAFGVAAAMENDADAAALGEWRCGHHNAPHSLICITIGTGIGAGIILNGQLYRGAGGSHPELGHHIIEPAGPACTCGAHGCWESLASGPALEQWFREQTSGNAALTAKEIFALARAGEPSACVAVRREARYLGMGLANIVSVLMPEVIVLGGSLMHGSDLLLNGLRTELKRNCGLVPHGDVKISVASLGADVGLIGAAQVWHHRFHS